MIHITEVTTKAQLRQFVNFPIDLYRDVPPVHPRYIQRRSGRLGP